MLALVLKHFCTSSSTLASRAGPSRAALRSAPEPPLDLPEAGVLADSAESDLDAESASAREPSIGFRMLVAAACSTCECSCGSDLKLIKMRSCLQLGWAHGIMEISCSCIKPIKLWLNVRLTGVCSHITLIRKYSYCRLIGMRLLSACACSNLTPNAWQPGQQGTTDLLLKRCVCLME